MYTTDLSGNVTLCGQKKPNWCGAANAQMTRNGYPNLADRKCYSQQDLQKEIKSFNSSDPHDVAQKWASDPHGLRGCLQDLANPAGVQWKEFSDATRDTVLFDILSCMDASNYPSPVLIDAGWHWVVIVKWTTDVQPIAGSNPTLLSIDACNPKPLNVGSYNHFTASQWYAGPWHSAVELAGTWKDQYVAVVEPPIGRGRVRVNEAERTGERILTPDEALTYVQRAIDQGKLGENPKFALLVQKDTVRAVPVLIREAFPGNHAGNVTYYYLAGFGLRGETDDKGEQLISVAVLVNAYSGALEEVTAFGKPIRYLTAAEAIAIAARATRVEPNQLNAELMFQYGDITNLRAYPFWRVTAGERIVYVDQLGQLYTKLISSSPGN